jgi:ABC-2 type transport system permease protein
MAKGYIAELGYRNYEGPTTPVGSRWRVIARATFRNAITKRSFWVLTLLSAWYYLLLIAVLFFMEQGAVMEGGDRMSNEFLSRFVWADQLLLGFSTTQILWLILTLIVGAGAIANDNASNALLVYLSKPTTKRDYVFGKLAGIWGALAVAMALPTAFFLLYGALNLRAYGFLTDDPWLVPKMLVIVATSSFFYAALITGMSSLFNRGAAAGGAFAGLFFLLFFYGQGIKVAWVIGNEQGTPSPELVQWLYYLSIDRLQIGWVKAVLDTRGSPMFGANSPVPEPAAPPLWLPLLLLGGLSALSLWIAMKRVKAVEVVS